MNEGQRTLVYVGVAAAIVIAAVADGYWRDRGVEQVSSEQLVGKPMFADFKDPLAAKSLEITTFDEAQAAFTEFKVAQVNGRWVIPSHGSYPADAEKQLGDAATELINVEALGVAGNEPSAHAEFGVIEPSSEKLQVGAEGVGTLVVMQDAKGNDLLRLIIGKPAGDEAGRDLAGQRFVRKPGEDTVYVAKIDPKKLPTDFDQWIEKDLLKLKAIDIAQLTLKDYSILPSQQGRYYLPRMETTVAWNAEKSNWDLKSMLLKSGQQMVESGLGDYEELNKQRLDDLKAALAELKIVDVIRKPEGLGASLTGGDDLVQHEQALSDFGFLLANKKEGSGFEIFASNGEVLVDMKDGVEYVLRFGKVQGGSKDGEAGKLNRFLFVTAQRSPLLGEAPPAPAAEAKPAEAKPDEVKPADAKTGDDKPADAKAAETPPAEDDEQAKARREQQRKLDEYNEKVKKADARIAELNHRFADWYYVISEDEYKKIHLSRADIVKETAGAKEEGFGPDAFRNLEKGGVNPPAPRPSAPPQASPFGM